MPGNHRSPTQVKKEPRSYFDALLQESARVLAAVQAPLKDLVTARVQSGNNDPHQVAQLVLTLHFTNSNHANNLWRFLSRNAVDAKRISAALDAVMLVYSHSRRLEPHGKLHAEFWTQLLSSKVMATEVSEETLTWMTTEFTLRMVLDFGGGSKRGELDKKWLDAVFMFMTESPECSKIFEHPDRRMKTKERLQATRVLLGLSFANSRLTVKFLVKIQRLLDCTAPGCNRHYGIDMLDLSHNAMTAEQLELVTQILKRNHIYQIQDIRRDETTKNLPMKHESRSFNRTTELDMSRTATEWASDIRVTSFTILPVTNRVDVQHVISMCSALRYGCAFEELSLASMIDLVDSSERGLCWRWLAFGIFYPRSKRLAAQFKLRTIKLTNSDVTSVGVEALGNVLYNPVAEFRRPGLPEDKFAMDAVLVGAIENGATVYSSADRLSKPLLTLAYQQEMEILHSRHDDEWVCVVVPGVGLGWLQTAHVISVEHGLEKHDTLADARFDLVIMNSPTHTTQMKMPRETHTFIETVGKYLRSLTVRNSGRLRLIKILYHCKNLVRLDLEGCDLQGESLSDLLRCLRSHLGRQLVSLNLSRTCLSDDDMVKLAYLLGDPQELRELKALRLYNMQVTHAGIESLHAALVKNNTLTTLELGQLGDDFDRDEKRARSARIRTTGHNEQLSIVPVSFDQRVAFISAVNDPRSKIKAAAEVQHSGAFRLIFQFAKEPDRRTISWTLPREQQLRRKSILSASRSTVSKRWQPDAPPLLKFLSEI